MIIMTMIYDKSYSELLTLKTYEDRFNYLKLNSTIGIETFGHSRHLNQVFYKSKEWLSIKKNVIVRDNGCDLALEDYLIIDRIYVHHINPITIEDVINRADIIFDMENLICTTFNTHYAIHYGEYTSYLESKFYKPRSLNDNIPWKK